MSFYTGIETSAQTENCSSTNETNLGTAFPPAIAAENFPSYQPSMNAGGRSRPVGGTNTARPRPPTKALPFRCSAQSQRALQRADLRSRFSQAADPVQDAHEILPPCDDRGPSLSF